MQKVKHVEHKEEKKAEPVIAEPMHREARHIHPPQKFTPGPAQVHAYVEAMKKEEAKK